MLLSQSTRSPVTHPDLMLLAEMQAASLSGGGKLCVDK